MDNETLFADDSLNASQILHMALQKMDGIISVNADIDKSDTVVIGSSENLLHSDQRLQPDDNTTTIATGLNYTTPRPYNSKQDKLNRLLKELKEYTKDEMSDEECAEVNAICAAKLAQQMSTNQSTNHPNNGDAAHNQPVSSNNGGSSPGGGANASAAASPSEMEKSTTSIEKRASMEYLHEASQSDPKESDRNGNFIHHQYGSEYHHGSSSQTDRIIQLESMVSMLRSQLFTLDDRYKKTVLSMKTLENANCDLLTVVEKLKMELTHSESCQKFIKEHNLKLESDIESYKNRFLEKETEVSSLRLTMAKIVRSTGYVLSDNELALLKGKTIASDFIKNKLIKDAYAEIPKPPMKCNAFYSEPSSRRESVASNFGNSSPVPPSRHQYVNRTLPSKAVLQSPAVQANLPMQRSTSAENMKMDSELGADKLHKSSDHTTPAPDYLARLSKSPYSTLPQNSKALRQIQKQLEECERQAEEEKFRRHEEMRHMSQSLMDEQLSTSKALSTPSSPVVNFKSSVHTAITTNTCLVSNRSYQSPPCGVKFGKPFFWLRRNKRAASAPELAKDDELIPALLQSNERNGIAPPKMMFADSKPKGLKKIFSRKRSSASLSESFSRGGFRATSGPRLGFNQERKFANINLPFGQWDTALVADWFAVIGLGMYVNECKRWCRNGEHLMKATAAEVEKELGIKNFLHRKKLRLAVASMNDEDDEMLKNAGKLDYLWVARWLDDIGLPQYKDAFIDARVDGRMLHYLTVEDLFFLKVTSQLHFASIRTGIKILRDNNFNGQCLKRRAAPEEASQTEWSTEEVALWTSHRVMEWLRSIDLSEYAPNLRGSGVHGALVLYENAFNADLFATLLSIPTNKTLLRRHISSKFRNLIGEELGIIKCDFTYQPNYNPMIPGSKVKAHKRGHFSLRRKRCDYELTDYVCPMTPLISKRGSASSATKSTSTSKENSPAPDQNSVSTRKTNGSVKGSSQFHRHDSISSDKLLTAIDNLSLDDIDDDTQSQH